MAWRRCDHALDMTAQSVLIPADEAEAGPLNVLFGHDPHRGRFQPGQTSRVIPNLAEMQDMESDLTPVPGGGEVNVLLEGDGDAGEYDSTTDFALGLVDVPTSSVADLLSVIRANAGRADEPITAAIVPDRR